MAITTNGKVSITNLQVGSSDDLAGIISDESGTGVLAFTTSPTFTTPALGTPSAVTLTNGTGLPVSGISASTSDAIGVGTIELGHATDTTISRVSAGLVAVEGVNVVTESATQTLTNKTISGASNTLTVRLDQSDVTGTLVTTKGGTGLSTYTTGDVVYANASNTLAKLAIGTSGQTLSVSAGGIVEWTTPSAGTTANDQAFAFAVQVFA
jgi:hypothetical protein